jgi:hypothetical protein
MLKKEFVPHEEALALKELGFDEPCLKFYVAGKLILALDAENGDTNSKLNGYNPLYVSAPTFSQAFRWIREKYWYTALILCDSFQIVMQLSTSKTLDSKTWEWKPIYVTQTYHKEEGLKSYDESELACLKQLIEIAKEKNNEQQ